MPGDFLTADLDGMLRTTEFASVAQILSGDHATETIEGILDNPDADSFGVAGSSPVFVARSAPALEQGDEILIGEQEYRIKAVEPDDTGVTRYPLTEI